MRETTSRPSSRPPTTGRHAGTRFLATDAAPGRGVATDLRRVATWLRHHAPIGVTTAERFHATGEQPVARECHASMRDASSVCVPAGAETCTERERHLTSGQHSYLLVSN